MQEQTGPTALQTTSKSKAGDKEFTFVAQPPIDVEHFKSDPAGMDCFTYLRQYLWLLVFHPFDDDKHIELAEVARKILPLLECVVGGITLDPHYQEGDNQLALGINMYPAMLQKALDQEGHLRAITIGHELALNLTQQVQSSMPIQVGLANYYVANQATLIEEAITNGKIDPKKTKPVAGKAKTAKKNTLTVHTNVSMHSVSQFLVAPQNELYPLKDAKEAWFYETGKEPDPAISKYGIDLTEIQMAVLFGTLHRLSVTNYKGDSDLKPLTKEDIRLEFEMDHIDKLPEFYRNVTNIPKIRVGRRELVRLAGMDYDNQADAQRVVEALGYLATTQFCFLYSRTGIDKKGKFQREANGDYKKQQVYGIETLLRVRIVNDSSGAFEYYEISPSQLFMEQRDKFFMLIPHTWMQEVKKLAGPKKVSNYTFLVILYLRRFFELERQARSKKSRLKDKSEAYELKMSWGAMARAINIPDDYCRNQRAKAMARIDDAYRVAQALGYLTSYTKGERVDTLTLNPERFPRPKGDTN